MALAKNSVSFPLNDHITAVVVVDDDDDDEYGLFIIKNKFNNRINLTRTADC